MTIPATDEFLAQLAKIRAVIAGCKTKADARLATFPRDEDVRGSEGERESLRMLRSNLIGRPTRLISAADNLGRELAAIKRDYSLREHYSASKVEFERALAELEALPEAERRRAWRQVDQLRASLKVLLNGPENFGTGEVVPTPLYDRLLALGVQPERGNGRMFPRGGLLRLDAEISERQKAIEKRFEEITRSIADVERLVATPLEATV